MEENRFGFRLSLSLSPSYSLSLNLGLDSFFLSPSRLFSHPFLILSVTKPVITLLEHSHSNQLLTKRIDGLEIIRQVDSAHGCEGQESDHPSS